MYERAYNEVKKIIDNVDINEDNLFAVINEIRNQIYNHLGKDSDRFEELFEELAEAYNVIEEFLDTVSLSSNVTNETVELSIVKARAALSKFDPTTQAEEY